MVISVAIRQDRLHKRLGHDEEDLIAQANDSVYGLACGIWTADYRRAWRVARPAARQLLEREFVLVLHRGQFVPSPIRQALRHHGNLPGG